MPESDRIRYASGRTLSETVSNTTKLAQGIATNVKQTKSETANNTDSGSANKVVSILSKGAKIADTVKQITANFVQTEQVEPTYISPAPTSIQESITNTSTQTETASRQPQTTSPKTSFSVALAPATKKYLIIGGVALAGGLAVFALTRKR